MSKVLSTSSPKDLSLEAVRGVASIVVFVWHFFFAFDPNFIFEPSRGLIGLPIYGFFHGTAAVDLFFLLSGYVLTRRFFDTHNGHLLVLGAAKRWFRLMPLVLFSTLFSWVCYHYSLYAFENAALVTRSEWLFLGGGARFPPVDPPLWDAVWQGIAGSFFFQETNFNTNLWTIRIEFFGSMMAFAVAWCFYKLQRYGAVLVCGLAFALCVGVAKIDMHYTAFVLGPLLAFAAPRLKGLSWKTGLPLFLFGFFMLGYRIPMGLYSFMLPVARVIERDTLYVITSMIGSAMIIVSCIGWEGLNKRMQGGVSRWLGQISFPLYLIHIIMICSLGAAVFARLVATPAEYVSGLVITALVLVPTTFGLATLLSFFDRWWVREINATFAKRYQAIFKPRRV